MKNIYMKMKGEEEIFVDSICRMGFYGPGILQFVNLLFLIQYPGYILFYILFAFFGMHFINTILKNIFKFPRPEGLEKISSTYDKSTYYEGTNKYGMPSNHAGTTAFITTFVWLITKNIYMTYFNLVIMLFTVFQRWKFKRHTLSQLIVGLALGGVLGLIVFNVIQSEIIKK